MRKEDPPWRFSYALRLVDTISSHSRHRSWTLRGMPVTGTVRIHAPHRRRVTGDITGKCDGRSTRIVPWCSRFASLLYFPPRAQLSKMWHINAQVDDRHIVGNLKRELPSRPTPEMFIYRLYLDLPISEVVVSLSCHVICEERVASGMLHVGSRGEGHDDRR
jgi:hypothetical protein